MATNELLPFAAGVGANVLTQAQYAADSQRTSGNVPGVARSALVNKASRQAAFVASMIGQFIVDKTSLDVLDNGDVAALLNNFIAALSASPAFTGTPTAPTPTAGNSTTRIATTAFVQNAVQGVAIAPGFVLPFAASTPPSGWLRANGAAVSRTTYAALFAAIGTTYGAGDGSTTFNLPDVRAEFPRFWDDGRGIDANPSPRVIGSTQLGTAFVFDIGSNASVTVSRVLGLNGLQSRAAVGVDSGVVSDYNSAVGYYSTASTASGGLPESAELNWGVMRPRNIALLGCIKY